MRRPRSDLKELPEISSIQPDREQQASVRVVELIRVARERAVASVNTTLIDLHWQLGEFIAQRIDTDGGGKGTVTALADYIRPRTPAPNRTCGKFGNSSSPIATPQNSRHC